MERFNEYAGPNDDDYVNVCALNTMFLRATADLKGPQRGRLSASPFLLFSLRERDLKWWDDALAEQGQLEFDSEERSQRATLRQIQIAALGFLWQLAHRNPYATRIISGASVEWCDKISAIPLVTLVNRIGHRDDLIVSRVSDARSPLFRLLADGANSNSNVRRATQIAALHTLITESDSNDFATLPAAACSLNAPARIRVKKL